MENELSLTQDRIDALVEACRQFSEACWQIAEAVKDAFIKCAKELYEKFVKPIIRHFFLLQLLEWKVPFWLARILQNITPWFGVRKIGLRYWQKKFV